MRPFLRELALSFRILLRHPGNTLISILILGTGLALTMFMFGAINAFILRPLPFHESDQLVHMEWSNPSQGEDSLSVPVHDFLEWRVSQRNMESLAAFYQGTINLSGNSRPERFDGAYVTTNVFDVLKIKPHLGRLFVTGEDQPGANPVVILGYHLWRNRYDANPNIIGQTIRVNARNTVVVGVMPPDFRFPAREDVWIPLSLDISNVKRSDSANLEVFGRLRKGATIAHVRSEFRTIAERQAKENPEIKALVPVVKPYEREYVDDETRSILFAMFGAVLLVLLIACGNVANLTLARSLARSREFAIRSALGADRWRLIVNIFTECVVISFAGGLIGSLLAEWAGHYTIATLKNNPNMAPPYWIEMGTDWRTLLFGIGAALFAALLAGLLPSFRASRTDLVTSLHQGGYSSAKPLGKVSRSLVTGQIALSCVLLISAGLMTRSVLKLRHIELGANIDGILTGRIGLFEAQYPDSDSQLRFYQKLIERLGAIQGIQSATITSSLPGTFVPSNYVTTEKNSTTESNLLPVAHQASIAPNYFTTFKVPLIKGRFFDSRDHKDAQKVVIVNKMLAEQFWPGADAVGQRLRLGELNENNPWLTVVGVVSNVQQDEVDEKLSPTLYLPIEQEVPRFVSIVLRTTDNPMRYSESLRKAVQEIDPDLPVYWVRLLDEWIQIGRFGTSFLATLFGIFAIAAILLAATGQYAVLAYTVNQRKREIGVRRALGAVDKELVNMFLNSGLKQFAIALIIGLPIAFGFATLISSELFNVKAFDPFTFFIVPAALLVVSLFASVVPAKRALKVDPAIALRNE